MKNMQEYLISNDSKFTEAFESVKGTVKDSDVIEIKVKFDENISKENFVKSLNEVLDNEEEVFNYATDEHEYAQNYLFDIDLKNLSKELKLEAFKISLTRDTVVDSKIILNIYNLIKTYNSFEDTFFAHPDVYFNTLEEYLDIRTDLMDDIKAFSKQLIIYYLSCLKSLHVTEADTAYANMKPIPPVFQRILFVIDFFTLSKIMNKMQDINLSDLMFVQNSNKYLDELCAKELICKDIADFIS